jgi:hypothetical protein
MVPFCEYNSPAVVTPKLIGYKSSSLPGYLSEAENAQQVVSFTNVFPCAAAFSISFCVYIFSYPTNNFLPLGV